MRYTKFLLTLLLIAAQVSGAINASNTTPLSDNNRVIYELNVYDFTPKGTFAAAEQRLSELRNLGIDIIWLMPIFPRGIEGKIGDLGSPYAVRDFQAVNPAHGTLADFKSFVNTAHGLGMSVWLDWVPNHTSLDHPWTVSHPEYYYRVNNVIQHPNNYGDVYQLNYKGGSGLNDAMIEAMRYWVEEADVDGFRCDYVSSTFIGAAFWTTAIAALQDNTRNKRVEFLAEADFTSSDVQENHYETGFRYDYAWGFAEAIKSVGTGTSVTALTNAANAMINTLEQKYSGMSRMSFLTNHDDIGNNFSSNYMTKCGGNVAPLTVMYFTFCGMPLLYNGQEIGQTKILNYFNRNDIDWNNVNTKIANTIRVLVAMKHTLPALADGTAAERANARLIATGNSSVFAYEKSKGDNIVLVVLNLGTSAVDVTLSGVTAGDYTRLLDSQTIRSGHTTTSTTLSASPTIHLESKGYHVYSNRSDFNTCHLYVDNQTSWSTFDLYAWGDYEYFGKWPGVTSPPTVTMGGTTYKVYDYTVSKGENEMNMHLIFHNNVGEGKSGDKRQLLDLTKTGDYYITVRDNGVTVSSGSEQIDTNETENRESSNRKILRNGHLLIIHDGDVYNVLGSKLQ